MVIICLSGFDLGKAAQLFKSGDNGSWFRSRQRPHLDRAVHGRRAVCGSAGDHSHHRCAIDGEFPRFLIQRCDGLPDCSQCMSSPSKGPEAHHIVARPAMVAYSTCTDNSRPRVDPVKTRHLSAVCPPPVPGPLLRCMAACAMPMPDIFLSFSTWKQQRLILNNATKRMKCCSTA